MSHYIFTFFYDEEQEEGSIAIEDVKQYLLYHNRGQPLYFLAECAKKLKGVSADSFKELVVVYFTTYYFSKDQTISSLVRELAEVEAIMKENGIPIQFTPDDIQKIFSAILKQYRGCMEQSDEQKGERELLNRI